MGKKRDEITLTDEDVELLNSKLGMKHLFATHKVDVAHALKMTRYETELREMQARLVQLQHWVIECQKRVVVVVEGRDAAGKGGAIQRITAHINPRHYRTVALPQPTESERGEWYFQRYVNHLPKPGEIVFFDRSWYNRAIVEPVNGFCTDEQYQRFMGQVNAFEKMLVESGIHFIKLYFSINKQEQAKRFEAIRKSPLEHWKMTPVDENAQRLWNKTTQYKNVMFEQTNTEHAPWVIIDANDNTAARLEALAHILETVPYVEGEDP